MTQEPTCIYLRAKSPYGDIVRYHPTKFAICLGAVIYNHAGREYPYRFYEWFVPLSISEGISWDILFYVPYNYMPVLYGVVPPQFVDDWSGSYEMVFEN